MPKRSQQRTSIEAFRAGDWRPLEERMHAYIVSRGEDGVILDDMLAAFPEFPGTTLSSSIGHLVRDGRAFRRGDSRKGRFRQQLISRDIALAPPGYVPPVEQKRTGFAAGLQYAKKLLEEAGEIASGIRLLEAEINKQGA